MSLRGADEFRVEVDLDDDEHGLSLGERLRARDLDDRTRERLGGDAVVTRDGAKLFVYTSTEDGARAAEEVVREIVAADELSASFAVTRWHEVEQAWKDAALPLPSTEQELRSEEERRERAEEQEARQEGSYDWHVVVHAPDRAAARELEEALERDGVPTTRRWRYLYAQALTEERAIELEERIRARAAPGTETWVEPDLTDVPGVRFLFLPA